MARWVMWKKPARFTAVTWTVVVDRVLRERLGDEDAGVVDRGCRSGRIDRAPRATTRSAVSASEMSPRTVTKSAIVRRLDRPRRPDDRVAGLPEGADDAGADALRRAGDDRDPARLRRSLDEVGLVDHAVGLRPPTLTKMPLLSQSSSGAAVSIRVDVRKVYSLASTGSPRASRARTSGRP